MAPGDDWLTLLWIRENWCPGTEIRFLVIVLLLSETLNPAGLFLDTGAVASSYYVSDGLGCPSKGGLFSDMKYPIQLGLSQ